MTGARSLAGVLVVLVIVGLAIGALLAVAVRRSRASKDLVGGQLRAAEVGPLRPATGVPDEALRGEIEALVNRNRKIEAIKLVRERTGMGLKDAKDLVDAMAAGRAIAPPGVPAPAPSGGLPSGGLPPEVLAQVRALKDAGKVIHAVKLVRDQTRMGLKDAKDLVDGL